MDTNKRIARAMLKKSFAEAKELVFKSLYAKASLALDEARYTVANAIFNEAKKPTTYSVPAGASEEEFAKARAANPYRVRLNHPGKPAGAVDKAVKEEAELDEMAQTKERAKETGAEIDRTHKRAMQKHKEWSAHSKDDYTGYYDKEDEFDKERDANWRAHERQDMERDSKDLYGKGGKIIKKNKDNLLKKRPTYGGKAAKK